MGIVHKVADTGEGIGRSVIALTSSRRYCCVGIFVAGVENVCFVDSLARATSRNCKGTMFAKMTRKEAVSDYNTSELKNVAYEMPLVNDSEMVASQSPSKHVGH